MSRKAPQKSPMTKRKFIVHSYTVVEFEDEEENDRLFECIPDLWFVNELRETCFFPPRTGRTYQQRAISCEKPNDDWSIHPCKIVTEGFSTYNAGFKLVKEKCAQRYNTSSAEEHIQAEAFRRKHPTSIYGNIEQVFTNPISTPTDSPVVNEISESNFNGDTLRTDSGENSKATSQKTNSKQTTSKDPAGRIDKIEDFSEKNKIEQKRTHRIPGQSRKISNEAVNQTGIEHPIMEEYSVGENSEGVLDKKRSNHTTSIDAGDIDEVSAFSKKRKHLHTKHPHRIIDSSSSYNSDRSRSKDSSISQSFNISRSGGRQLRDSRSRSRSVLSPPLSRQSSSRSCSNGHQSSRRSGSAQSKGSDDTSSRSCSRSLSELSGRELRSNLNRFSRTSQRRTSCSSTSSKQSQSSSHRSSVRSHRRYSHATSTSKQPRNIHSGRKSKPQSSQTHSNAGRSRRTGKFSPARLSSQSSTHRSHSNIGKGHRNNENKSSSYMSDHHRNKDSHIYRNKSTFEAGSGHNSRQMGLRKSPSFSNSSVKELIASVDELTKTVKQYNDQMAKNDRRLNRLEVTVNKIFITVGDMNGNNRMDEMDLDEDFDFPELPICSKKELYIVHKKLKDKEFRKLWLSKERNYCCPTKTSTDCVTITKYLKRFVDLNVRCLLTLKERGERTLYKDYNRVYLFLIDVMKEGYRISNKKITQDEAHTALRVVWGRSKQLNEKK